MDAETYDSTTASGIPLFKLLADSYLEPDAELFRNLADLDVVLKAHGIEFHEDAEALLCEVGSPEHDALLKEYAKLFVGPFKLLAPPFGSTYLDDGLMMGESTSSVKALYREAGLEMAEDFKSPPDHIGAELEFYAYLLAMEHAAQGAEKQDEADRYRDIRQRFFTSHLGQWGPKFAQQVSGNSESRFYSVLGRITGAVLENEKRSLLS